MNIISQARLEKAVYGCRDQLDEVAKFVLPERKEAFLKAVETYDSRTVNAVISESFQHYLGESNLLIAFEQYCKKFGFDKDFSTTADVNVVLFIADQQEKISTTLKQAGM